MEVIDSDRNMQTSLKVLKPNNLASDVSLRKGKKTCFAFFVKEDTLIQLGLD